MSEPGSPVPPTSPLLSRVHTSAPDTESAIDRSIPEFPAATPIDEDNYFRLHRPPPYLSQISSDVAEFINFHHRVNRKVALVTSGGTTVPLENNTVRFIDNFSAGTRGATSAEYFLEKGYAVIFLHREFSMLPYSRHYSHTTNCFLDYLTESPDGKKVEVDEKFQKEMLVVLKKYRYAQENNLLLMVPFTTVHQYLFTLKLIAQEMSVIGYDAIFYLAAAVSDFFLPSSRIPQHKIQSKEVGGKLVVDLEPVPKFLRRLVDSWAPIAMIVSFKLETDNTILISKARTALKRYNHQLVIGNLLQTRKKQVVFVTAEGERWIKLDPEQIKENVDIESIIVPEIINSHNAWIESRKRMGL
ncbi:DEKNAAC100628 [Brettanomyces naardenensis]|uniref:DEKNAAC100628 n=1 Tax=Brettanomyces naardenensis TaxID=13370 RepID=A0A448YF99_BRENA|nr:DEKNAAC100628 [Brettanomyces naardenensis]